MVLSNWNMISLLKCATVNYLLYEMIFMTLIHQDTEMLATTQKTDKLAKVNCIESGD